MIKLFCRLSLVCVVIFVVNIANALPSFQNNNGYIVNITDIHFDPFYDSSIVQELIESDVRKWDSIFKKSNITSFGSYTTDTNYKLLDSALKSLKERAPYPDFIIYSGDFICHNFNTQFASFDQTGSGSDKKLHDFIYKTVEFVILKLSEIYPNTPFYLTLGNDDSYIGDYKISYDGAFLKDTSTLFKKKIFFSSPEQVLEFYKTYEYGGFYHASVSNIDNAEIIVLNSIFFTSDYEYNGNPDTHPGRLELDWLAKKFEKAERENKRIWILTHVPVGINVYSTLAEPQNSSGRITGSPVMYVENDFNIEFIDLIRRFYKNIEIIFVGHTHMDWFELYNDKEGEYIAYNHLSPSISPVYGNNPAFQVMTYDRNKFKLQDYTVFFLNLAEANADPGNALWEKEYTFTEAYNQESCNLNSLVNVYQKMINSGSDDMKNYVNYYIVGNAAQSYINANDWLYYYLGIGYLLQEDFMDKTNKQL